MHIGTFGAVVCALVLLTWSAVGLYCYCCCRAMRCRRAPQPEWDELVRRYADLDSELDRVWQAAETGSRILTQRELLPETLPLNSRSAGEAS